MCACMCVCACSLKCVDAHGCSGQSTTLCILTQVIHLLFFLFFFIVVVIIVITLPWYTCRCLRSATGSGFSPSTMWVPGIPSKRGAELGWEQMGTFTAPEPPFWAVVGFVGFCFAFIYLEEGAMVLTWRSEDHSWVSFYLLPCGSSGWNSGCQDL